MADPGPALADLIGYALRTGLIESADQTWALNRAMQLLHLQEPGSYRRPTDAGQGPDEVLAPLLDFAVADGLIADTTTARDLFDAELMGSIMARPSEVADGFWRDYRVAPSLATDNFYRLCQDANYIHAQRCAGNPTWIYPSRYGDIDITINLAKPEKEPRDIIAAGRVASADYPACALCRENEGFAGDSDHPGRGNLRLVPVELDGQPWFLQYSPYRYFPEHSIVLSDRHVPMSLTRGSFSRLLEFVGIFSEYFLGSNADLPIVGGSILSHDHFQGGRYQFPIERASSVGGFVGPDGIVAEVLDWPLSVVRITGADPVALGDAGFALLQAWRVCDVPSTGVSAFTADTPHNTVTPIARRAGRDFQLDVVLRNNRTSAQFPDGIFHPHPQIHPVKKENIGLIEVMGLAVLPGRLARDIPRLASALTGESLPADLAVHKPMLDSISPTVSDPERAVRDAVARYFVMGLEHCAVLGPAAESLPLWEEFLAPLGYRGNWDATDLSRP